MKKDDVIFVWLKQTRGSSYAKNSHKKTKMVIQMHRM